MFWGGQSYFFIMICKIFAKLFLNPYYICVVDLMNVVFQIGLHVVFHPCGFCGSLWLLVVFVVFDHFFPELIAINGFNFHLNFKR